MRLFTRLLFCLSLLFTFGILNAQSEYAVSYQNEYIELSENINDFEWRSLDRSDRIQGGYYMWLQFYNTPSQDIQDRINGSSMQLEVYINNRTYLAFVPASTSPGLLASYGVRAIHPVPNDYKLSADLRHGNIGDWALKGDQLHVTLLHHDKVSTEYVLQELLEMDIVLDQEVKSMNSLDLLIPNDCLDELSALPFIKYVAVIDAPPVKEDEDARGLHRAANLDTGTPGDRNYDGRGIGVMVRDDGVVGPHIDFHGRINNSLASSASGSHGDGVAGILTGAGNLNPANRGMAAGADLYVVDYTSDFTVASTFNLIQNGSVQITNSSYGNGCNGGYTSIAALVDQQTNDFPSLLHVFSAGNSGGSNCDYGAGSGWGNITGGHKQGKNVIATANSFSDGGLASSSSKGPASDGRIKPDITANGQNQISTAAGNGYSAFGGTSGASPGVAGVSAQLYQAYQELHGGEMPESALIKATLLNTANDYGNPGPDFNFGWGMLNGLRAVKLLEDGRFLNDTIVQGATNTHTISVPEGTAQVRFMVYWRDPAAMAGATTALINDLDMKVVGQPSAMDTLLPYILDPTPNPTTLNADATNGEDHLNNMEQVVINDPEGGDYVIDISGFNVPVGPQSYYIVYEVISDNLTLTYPNTRVNLVSNTTAFIHWDAVNVNTPFQLEYSNDNGGSWQSIGTAPAGARLRTWSVPNGLTGEALVRVTSGSYQDVSDTTFSYGRRVTGLNVNAACPTSMTFSWNVLAGANKYDLYVLGEKFMEVVGSSTTNSITVDGIELGTDVWYAVAARDTTTGAVTRRTNAVLYNGGLLNCVINKDMTITEIGSTADDFSSVCNPTADGRLTVTLYNNGLQDEYDFEVSYQVENQDPVSQLFTDTIPSQGSVEFTFDEPVDFPGTGNYTIDISVNTSGDEYVANNDISSSFYILGLEDAPFVETFEEFGFPSTSWRTISDDNSLGWEEVSVLGADGATTTAGYMNNFSYNAAGQRDYVQTAIYAIGDTAMLTFDLAKAQYDNSFSDAFAVEISTDCGATFEEIYYKDGAELSTVTGFRTSPFSPSQASEWRTDTVDLAAYRGENVLFQFVNITGYGNSTYLDNVNVQTGPPIVINADMTVANILNSSDDFSTICNSQADSLVRVTLVNNAVNEATNFAVSYQLNDETPVTEIFTDVIASGSFAEFTFATPLVVNNPGEFELTISVDLDGDEVADNNEAAATFFLVPAPQLAPFEDDFEENGFPTADWTIINPDENLTWEEVEIVGADGNATTAGFVNNSIYDPSGELDMLQTVMYTIGDSMELSFDLAKAQFNAVRSDALRVEASTDCGASFEEIYFKDGLSLSTVLAYQNTPGWEPTTAEEWRREVIDLSTYAGQNVIFQFVNITDNGNGTFIDNVNLGMPVDTVSSVAERYTLQGVEVFPNPTSAVLNVRLPNDLSGVVRFELLNNVGQLVRQQQTSLTGAQLPIDVSAQPAGVYYLRITNGQQQAIKKVMIN